MPWKVWRWYSRFFRGSALASRDWSEDGTSGTTLITSPSFVDGFLSEFHWVDNESCCTGYECWMERCPRDMRGHSCASNFQPAWMGFKAGLNPGTLQLNSLASDKLLPLMFSAVIFFFPPYFLENIYPRGDEGFSADMATKGWMGCDQPFAGKLFFLFPLIW